MESESLHYWDSQQTLEQVCYNYRAFSNEIPDILPFSGYLLVKQVPVKHVSYRNITWNKSAWQDNSKEYKNESDIYSMVNLVAKGSKLKAWHKTELHTGEPIPN